VQYKGLDVPEWTLSQIKPTKKFPYLSKKVCVPKQSEEKIEMSQLGWNLSPPKLRREVGLETSELILKI